MNAFKYGDEVHPFYVNGTEVPDVALAIMNEFMDTLLFYGCTLYWYMLDVPTIMYLANIFQIHVSQHVSNCCSSLG